MCPDKKVKVRSYIAQYRVTRTAQTALHFTHFYTNALSTSLRVVSWRPLRWSLKVCLARLVVDIRLRALIAKLVLGYISTEFERKRNAVSTMHQ